MEKYITFAAPIEKELQELIKMERKLQFIDSARFFGKLIMKSC